MKKLISVLLSCVMLFGMMAVIPLNTSAAEAELSQTGTSKSAAEAIAWAQSQVGQSIDMDGYPYYQCVDFIQAYYQFLGVSPAWGNGADYTWNDLPSGWNRYQGVQPQYGDILVYTGGYNNYGHVAIYESDYVTYHQNFDYASYVTRVTYKYNGLTTPYWGVIRPNFNEEVILDYGSDFYCLLLNQPAWKPFGQTDSGNVEAMDETRANMARLLWHCKKTSDGKSYYIESLLNGKRLDVYNIEDANGTNIQCWNANDSNAQKFYFIRKNGVDAIRPVYSSRVLDFSSGSTATGTNIQLWEWNGTNAQKIVRYDCANENLNLNYTISTDKAEMEKGDTAKISIGGSITYVYNYKFHIVDQLGKETVVDNGSNGTYSFSPEEEGRYIIFAEIKNPKNTEKGSVEKKCVTVTSGCAHEFSDRFVPAKSDGEQGYILHSCTKCDFSYQDNFMDYKDGWYTPADGSADLPDLIKNDSAYTEQYKNYSEKIQKNSPGEGWVNKGVVKNEWVNKGYQYDSYTPLATSNERVLVKECYYHYCIPGGEMGSEGNYEPTDRFSHYDEITLPNQWIVVKWTGDDNGHTVYVLSWGEGGPEVYCKSGETCDGSWGYHDYRCRAWYKKYVYQDREKIELYKWVKDTGWTDAKDASADKTECRFCLTETGDQPILGDADGDGEVAVTDATWIQRKLANLNVVDTFNEKAADVDGNGEVAVTDATWIQRKLANLNIPYAVGEKIG